MLEQVLVGLLVQFMVLAGEVLVRALRQRLVTTAPVRS